MARLQKQPEALTVMDKSTEHGVEGEERGKIPIQLAHEAEETMR